MRRTFVQADLFKERLDELPKAADLLHAIEAAILESPSCGDLIVGTGGVRKMRIADPSRPGGKSGGYRILYLDLPHVERTHLLYVYGKTEADSLSSQGKKVMKRLSEMIRKEAK